MNPILQVLATFFNVNYIGYAFFVLLIPCLVYKLLYRRSDR